MTLFIKDQIKNAVDEWFTATNKAGTTVTRTPVTKTISGDYGSETLTDGTPASIDCYFSQKFPKPFFISEEGEVESGDAFILVKSTQALNKNDKITYDSRVYRVKDTYRVVVNGTLCGIQGNLFLID
jgi:hypothetical protein